ncbi:T-complex protein 1 subunit gamma [Canna indica]|uniref:T-complex protein 1 subunit gamma n=1 Tax=Canna indica TaxID=4628 RepID=A0AAQ3QIX8_9LILI|nr:T-complex protein 1 subunit gamma [Canna indica]
MFRSRSEQAAASRSASFSSWVISSQHIFGFLVVIGMDVTTSEFSGEMLHVAAAFINKNFHPTVICRAYNKALEDSIAVLDKIAMPIDVTDRAAMLGLVKSCIDLAIDATTTTGMDLGQDKLQKYTYKDLQECNLKTTRGGGGSGSSAQFQGLMRWLGRIRKKRVMLVGDSIMRNQWESLVCLVEAVIPSDKKLVSSIFPTAFIYIHLHNRLTSLSTLDYGKEG